MKIIRPEEIYDEIFQKYDEQELEALGELLDEHVDWGNSEGEGNPLKDGKEGKDKNGNTVSKKKPTYSKEDLRKIRDSN